MAEHHDHIVQVSSYVKVFVALMILWALTSFAATKDLDAYGHNLGFFVAFAIAATKALLIVLIFMHVKFSSKVVWIFAAASFFWLGIMFVFTFGDYATRGAAVGDHWHLRDDQATEVIPAGNPPAEVQRVSGK